MSTDGTRRRFDFVSAILGGLAALRSPPPRHAPAHAAPSAKAPDAADLSAGPGHEVSDVHVGNTARVMAGLMLTAFAVVGSMVWFRHTVASDQRQALPSLTRQQTARLVPPPPNLQADPYADLDAQRAEEAQRLDGFAFLDAARQRARIPIDRAMALTVGRSLDPVDR